MTNIIIEISKYLIILLMALYTLFNFRFFGAATWKKKNRVCMLQNHAMFLMHFLAYVVLYLKIENEGIITFYLAQLGFLICYIYLSRLFYHNISRLLINNMCMLLCVGFIILTRISMEKAFKQFTVAVISAVVTWIIPYIIDRVWQLSKIPWVYGLIGLVLLFTVCVAGTSTFGAQLAINIGGVSFQPSEFVKISFVFFVATMFYQSVSFTNVLVTTGVAAVHILILVASRDLGSALIFFTTYLLMLFIATSNWLYLGIGLLSGSAASVLAYKLFGHIRVRVSAWLNPWADIDNKGYQITQSLFAIGTGGWFGLGLCQGLPGKIPVVEKDFAFAAVSEELGGVFALCLIFICLGCFIQFMMIAGRLQAMFYKLIAFGLGIVYITQVFLTVGGVTKFIPSTGVTLPLVSYGGSSILSTFIIFSIIQGLYLLKRNEEEVYEKN